MLDRGSGRIRKNRLIHYHCNDGLTGGGEGRKKREEKTAMDGRIVWRRRRGREKRRFFFWWNLATTIPPPVVCTRSTRTMTDQLRFRDDSLSLILSTCETALVMVMMVVVVRLIARVMIYLFILHRAISKNRRGRGRNAILIGDVFAPE